MLANASESAAKQHAAPLTPAEVRFFLTSDDLSRLASYAHNLVDYHMIMDLLPQLARLYFARRLGEVSLSALQETILIGQGLQHKTVDQLMGEFPKVDSSQVLALFNRSVRKMQKYLEVGMRCLCYPGRAEQRCRLRGARRQEVRGDGDREDAAGRQESQRGRNGGSAPAKDLQAAGKEVTKKMEAKNRADLEEYAIQGSENEWSKALRVGAEARNHM